MDVRSRSESERDALEQTYRSLPPPDVPDATDAADAALNRRSVETERVPHDPPQTPAHPLDAPLSNHTPSVSRAPPSASTKRSASRTERSRCALSSNASTPRAYHATPPRHRKSAKHTPCALEQPAMRNGGDAHAGGEHAQEDDDDNTPAPVATLAQRFAAAPPSSTSEGSFPQHSATAFHQAPGEEPLDTFPSRGHNTLNANASEEQQRPLHYLERLGVADATAMPNYKRSTGLRAIGRSIEGCLEARRRAESSSAETMRLEIHSLRHEDGLYVCDCTDVSGRRTGRIVALLDETTAEQAGLAKGSVTVVRKPW